MKESTIDLHVQLAQVYQIVMRNLLRCKVSHFLSVLLLCINVKIFYRIRDQLHTVIYRYPPTFQLSGEEQDLVWKYRFYLSTQKKALTKFLKCINWQTVTEVRQALNLLDLWTPMDVEDALELLSPNFQHPAVRRYAITRLKQAQDDDLLLYLLQLVQALKYENFDDIFESYRRMMNEKDILKSIDDNSTNDQMSSTSDSLGNTINNTS